MMNLRGLGRSHDLMEVLSWHLIGWIEENHIKFLGYPAKI
jgi:hypothetical protein